MAQYIYYKLVKKKLKCRNSVINSHKISSFFYFIKFCTDIQVTVVHRRPFDANFN